MSQESAQELFAAMRAERARQPLGTDIQFADRYANRIRAVGEACLLTTMFLDTEDADLIQWLLRLAPVWKDFPFATWRNVLQQISSYQPGVYQFVRFAGEMLAIDARKLMLGEFESGDIVLRDFERAYPDGCPTPTDWSKEVLEEDGVDYQSMWCRLASEGAPMNIKL